MYNFKHSESAENGHKLKQMILQLDEYFKAHYIIYIMPLCLSSLTFTDEYRDL